MSQDPVRAVLAPPDLWRFREITGVGDANLDVSFQGWSKLAVLTHDRVFMFPRRGRDAQLLHGARMCEVLTSLDITCVPRVLGRWPEGILSAGPFVAFERRPGIGWHLKEDDIGLDGVERMLRSLGQVIATWHRVPLANLPADIRHTEHLPNKPSWLGDFLDPHRVDNAVDAVVRLLHAPSSRASAWRTTLRTLSTMTPVLVHGDVNEGQLLVNEHGRVESVLDWDSAGIGHPLLDFDFGEWGFGIFAWEAEFGKLRRAMWDSYCAGRPGVDLPGAVEVHLLFTLSELAYFEEQSLQGALDDWGAARLARSREAIGPATDAVLGSPRRQTRQPHA